MALEPNTQIILDKAESISEALTDFYIPVSDGLKEINEEAITDALREAWEEQEESIFRLIEETDLAWALKPDLDDSDVDLSE